MTRMVFSFFLFVVGILTASYFFMPYTTKLHFLMILLFWYAPNKVFVYFMAKVLFYLCTFGLIILFLRNESPSLTASSTNN